MIIYKIIKTTNSSSLQCQCICICISMIQFHTPNCSSCSDNLQCLADKDFALGTDTCILNPRSSKWICICTCICICVCICICFCSSVERNHPNEPTRNEPHGRNSLLFFALFFIHVFGTYLSAKYFSDKIFKEGISLIRQYFRNCPNGLSVGFFYKMEYEVSESVISEWKDLVAHFEGILFARYA